MAGAATPSVGEGAPVTASRWSLRSRLAVTAGLAAALVLAATAVVIFLVSRQRMTADFDRTWQARGESLTSALEFHHHHWEVDQRPNAVDIARHDTAADPRKSFH